MANLKSGTTIGGHLALTTKNAHLAERQLTVACAATTNIDFNKAKNFYIVLDQSTTLTFSNIAQSIGKAGMILVRQDATGGWSITQPSQMKTFGGGLTISQVTSANTLSVYTYYIASATEVLVNYMGNFA